MTICRKCKTEIRPGEKVTIIHWHEGDERLHRDCIATLKQRIAELEAQLATVPTVMQINGFRIDADGRTWVSESQVWPPITPDEEE